MDRTELFALQQQRAAIKAAQQNAAEEGKYTLLLHDTDVIFSKDSLEEFIRLIQRQGINNLTIYSVSDLLAGNKYKTVSVRFPPPNWPAGQDPPQEFYVDELKDKKNHFVFVRYSFCWEEGGETLSDGSFYSNNEKNGRHVFVKTVNDITFYKTYLTDENNQLILDENNEPQIDTSKSSIFSEAFSDEIPLPAIFEGNREANDKNGTFTVTVDNIQYVIKIRGFNDDGEYIGKVKVDTSDMTPEEIEETKGKFLRGDGEWSNELGNDFLPLTNDTWDLGSENQQWQTLWVKEGNFSGPVDIDGNVTIGAASPNNVIVTINGRTLAIDSLPTSTTNTTVFLRGDGTWGNQLNGPMIVNSSNGPSSTFVPSNYTPSSTTGADFRCTGAGFFGKNLKANKVFNAVFNDYAECRTTIHLEAGRVVVDNDDGSLSCSEARLIPGAQVISDTFGHSMGYDEEHQTHLAVAGRVLAYPYQPRENYHAGMAVCSAPEGTVDIMTRDEIKEYPDCIVGIVSEIPNYERWGTDQIKVDGRIWIKVK